MEEKKRKKKKKKNVILLRVRNYKLLVDDGFASEQETPS